MISYLRIERFKCFEDVTIKFGKLTLLAGSNGTGKSTVIQALLLLRQAFNSFNLGILNGRTVLPLNGDIVKIGTAQDALFSGSREDTIAFTMGFTEERDKKFGWIFNVDKNNPQAHFMEGNECKLKQPYSSIFSERFSYLMAERWGPRLTYPMTALSSHEMHVGFQGEFTAHCLAEFGNNPIVNPALALKSDSETNTTLEHQTQLWMRRLIPGLALSVEPIIKADRVLLGVKVYSEQTNYLRPTNMGFGVCYTLPIVVAALMADQETLLIIENPEAHLHPAAQSQIGRFLAMVAASGVQIIIETHSDHVLNGMRNSVKNNIISNDDLQIHFFSRDKHQGNIIVQNPRTAKDGGIDKWPDGFFDQLERDLGELI